MNPLIPDWKIKRNKENMQILIGFTLITIGIILFILGIRFLKLSGFMP